MIANLDARCGCGCGCGWWSSPGVLGQRGGDYGGCIAGDLSENRDSGQLPTTDRHQLQRVLIGYQLCPQTLNWKVTSSSDLAWQLPGNYGNIAVLLMISIYHSPLKLTLWTSLHSLLASTFSGKSVHAAAREVASELLTLPFQLTTLGCNRSGTPTAGKQMFSWFPEKSH